MLLKGRAAKPIYEETYTTIEAIDYKTVFIFWP
jgi:hypothetical protein